MKNNTADQTTPIEGMPIHKSNHRQPIPGTGGINRRQFLAASAAASVFTILPRHVLGGPGQTPPSEKLHVAGIGVGLMGPLNIQALAPSLPRIPGRSHELDWVRAIKTGGQANAGFEYSGPLTELCLLGNVAKRVDGRIEWDAANLKVTNSEEANRLVHPPYRNGWSL